MRACAAFRPVSAASVVRRQKRSTSMALSCRKTSPSAWTSGLCTIASRHGVRMRQSGGRSVGYRDAQCTLRRRMSRATCAGCHLRKGHRAVLGSTLHWCAPSECTARAMLYLLEALPPASPGTICQRVLPRIHDILVLCMSS